MSDWLLPLSTPSVREVILPGNAAIDVEKLFAEDNALCIEKAPGLDSGSLPMSRLFATRDWFLSQPIRFYQFFHGFRL